MEKLGQRLKRLRQAQGWSAEEVGRRMALAVGREKPFTGEVVRLYEAGTNKPGAAARRALASIFKKSEAYIEFGSTGDAPNEDPLLSQLLRLWDGLSDDSKHAVLGYANVKYAGENPAASPANPFPNAPLPTRKPLIQGSLVGKPRLSENSMRQRKK